jgi:alkylation response protein AidB-like acyl-CoA dehydrogenase
MTKSAAASEGAPRPLTSLTEEESLFRQSVREFAEQQIRPLAPEMDEQGKFSPDLIQQFFDLGLMGIGIPEELGDRVNLLHPILAVEELSRVDASAGDSRRSNTLVLRFFAGETKSRRRSTARNCQRTWSGLMRCRKPVRAAMRSR